MNTRLKDGIAFLAGNCRTTPLTLAALVCFAVPAFAQSTTPVATPASATVPATLAAPHGSAVVRDSALELLDARVQGFFTNLALEGVPASGPLDDLLAGGPLAGSPDRLSLIESLSQFDARYGKFVEAELVSARAVGDDVITMHYLYKGKNFPVVWHFTFYRDFQRLSGAESFDRWVVIGVRFDTDLEAIESRELVR